MDPDAEADVCTRGRYVWMEAIRIHHAMVLRSVDAVIVVGFVMVLDDEATTTSGDSSASS